MDYDIRQNTGYKIRSCVLLHHVESFCSDLVRVHTRDAGLCSLSHHGSSIPLAPKPPILHIPEVLVNGSAVFTFVPGEDTKLVSVSTLLFISIPLRIILLNTVKLMKMNGAL